MLTATQVQWQQGLASITIINQCFENVVPFLVPTKRFSLNKSLVHFLRSFRNERRPVLQVFARLRASKGVSQRSCLRNVAQETVRFETRKATVDCYTIELLVDQIKESSIARERQ